MLTQCMGDIAGVGADEQPFKPEGFMKVRQGDRLTIAQDGVVQIVYFANGRRETWNGPAELEAGKEGGRTLKEGPGAPKVAALPFPVAGEMARISVLADSSRLKKTGAVVVRGATRETESDAPPPEPIPLSAEEQKKVDQAEKTYQGLLSASASDDITPELYFFSVLADYDQFSKMLGLLEKMEKKQPKNMEIGYLRRWMETQM